AVGGVFGAPPDDLDSAPFTGTARVGDVIDLRQSLEMAQGDYEILSLQLDRANAILEFSSRFRIPAYLATVIHDEAVRAGLDPDLAFRLVKVESNFNPNARSVAETFGL